MSVPECPGPEFLTFGCRLNSYESEIMRGHARAAGSAGPLIVVNTCAVTAEAERQARQAIRRASRERPGVPIVVTGCAAQLDPAAWRALPGVARVLGNEEKLQAANWTDQDWAQAPERVSDIMTARAPAPHPVPDFAGRARAFVQVQQGCDHRCTFCIIPFARGPNRSVPVGAIVEQVRGLVASGYREVVLTGVDIASYGADLPGRPSLGQMARRLLALVPGLPRLRLSSIDPAAIDEELWALIAGEARLMPHLHLSLQAASDLILKRMKRRHTVRQAAEVIERARLLRPGIGIGADLIAGFPTEDAALFAETLAFVRHHALPYLHVFPYSERPGTPAARMPALPVPERRERARLLREAGREAAGAFHASLLGTEQSVLLETAHGGHAEPFAAVRAARPLGRPGEIVRIRVGAADAEGLAAQTPMAGAA